MELVAKRKPTILVVDDEEGILFVVRPFLESRGYRVVTADNGHLAVRLAREESPALIVMDILMPDLSGGDAVKALREEPATASIPVVFLTAAIDQKDSGPGVNIDGTFYPVVAKPYDGPALLRKIEEMLAGALTTA